MEDRKTEGEWLVGALRVALEHDVTVFRPGDSGAPVGGIVRVFRGTQAHIYLVDVGEIGDTPDYRIAVVEQNPRLVPA